MNNSQFSPRKKNRLQGHDYSEPGEYFVTICVQDKECIFGKIEDGEMVLNEYGKIVDKQLQWLSQQYSYVQLDTYIIMPNHLHAIIGICDVGTGRDLSLQKIKSLSELVGAFKTRTSKYIRGADLAHFKWQRSFYDHIIRDEKALENIREYIICNPGKWADDTENPGNFSASISAARP